MVGSIKAKFDLISGPTVPSSTYVQFTSTDNILSGLEFELLGSGYRLSMVKRQFSSGNTVFDFCVNIFLTFFAYFRSLLLRAKSSRVIYHISTTTDHQHAT